MYPKGTSYVDDEYCFSRMVVIEDLPHEDILWNLSCPIMINYLKEYPRKFYRCTKNEVIKIIKYSKCAMPTIRAIAQTSPEAPAFTIHPGSFRGQSLLLPPQSAEGKLDVSNYSLEYTLLCSKNCQVIRPQRLFK